MTDSGWFYWLLGFWHFQPGSGRQLLIFFPADFVRLWDCETVRQCKWGETTPGVATGPQLSWWGSCYRYWGADIADTAHSNQPLHQRIFSPSVGLIVSTSMTRGLVPPPQTGGANIWSRWPSLWAVGKNTRAVPADLMVPLWSHWDHYVEIESLDTKQHQTTSVAIRHTVTINSAVHYLRLVW